MGKVYTKTVLTQRTRGEHGVNLFLLLIQIYVSLERPSAYAAGLVLRRFAMRKASPNITSENKSNVAIAEESGKVAVIPG